LFTFQRLDQIQLHNRLGTQIQKLQRMREGFSGRMEEENMPMKDRIGCPFAYKTPAALQWSEISQTYH